VGLSCKILQNLNYTCTPILSMDVYTPQIRCLLFLGALSALISVETCVILIHVIACFSMGGMEEMGAFYDNCLETLYPPGKCGLFCNEHTYECMLQEVQESCCDEGTQKTSL
jgi:hypothetical protein